MKRKFSSLFPESVFSRGFPKEILIYLKNRCLQLSYPASDSCLTSSPVPRGLGLVHSFLPCTKSRPFAQGIFFFFLYPCIPLSAFTSRITEPLLLLLAQFIIQDSLVFLFLLRMGVNCPFLGRFFFFSLQTTQSIIR